MVSRDCSYMIIQYTAQVVNGEVHDLPLTVFVCNDLQRLLYEVFKILYSTCSKKKHLASVELIFRII